MRGLLLELRWSSLRWWLGPLVLVDFAMLFLRTQFWIGVWPQASAAAQVPAFLLSPLCAATSAWAASRPRRREMVSTLDGAARPRWQPEAAGLGASLILAMIAYMAGIIAAAAVSFDEAGPGFLWPGYLWLGGLVVVASVAFGHLVGRSTRSPSLAAPAVAFASLLANFYLSHDLGYYAPSGPPDVVIALRPALARALPVLALLLAAVFLRRAWRRHSLRPRRATGAMMTSAGLALAVAACFVASLVVVSMSGSTVVARQPPATPMCTSGSVNICFWPDERKYLPFAQQMADRVTRLPHRLVSVPSTYYEFGLRGRDPSNNDFLVQEGDMWGVANSIALHIALATEPPYCSTLSPGDAKRLLHAEWQFEIWLTARIFGGPRPMTVHGGPPGVDIAAVASVARRSPPAQLRWARQELSIARSFHCESGTS